MQKLWEIKPRTKENLFEQLLENRGLGALDSKQAADFLHPDYKNLLDPFLFADMQKAVERIWQAIKNHEKIIIYSDYDADAITSNAVVFRALKTLCAKPEVFIPYRFSEG